tara:strand:- start:400 stop:711 length:312 start_codon:yes stop_codon:yes gene_type:complete
MNVSIDLTLIPLGKGISLSRYIAACKKEIEKRGLDYELGPNGTAIEGEWNKVFECVKACHEVVHGLGVLRIYSSVKINSRVDSNKSFRDKVQSVNSYLSEQTS